MTTGEPRFQALLKKARADYEKWSQLCAGL